MAATIAALSAGAVIAYFGTKNKTRKITSLRTFVQIALVFILFFGVFNDHFTLPIPAAEISPHELNISTNLLGVSMPDGLPAPYFGCYYPCGRTATCALWEIQAEHYPFFNTGGGWGVHYDSAGILRLAVVFGIIIFAAMLLGRFFCGWVCPFGLYLDLMTRLRKALKIKRRVFPIVSTTLPPTGVCDTCITHNNQRHFWVASHPWNTTRSGHEKGGDVYTYYAAPFCQVCPMKPLCLLQPKQARV